MQIQGSAILAWSPFISFPLQLQNNPMLSCAYLSFVTSEFHGGKKAKEDPKMSKTKLKNAAEIGGVPTALPIGSPFFAVIVWHLHLLLVWLRPGGEAKEAAAS